MITKEQFLISSAGFRPGASILFSKKNKNDFIRAAYIFIADYFNESLKKLNMQFPQAETVLRPVDETRFMAAVYMNGVALCSCKIWFGGSDGHSGRIAYSGSNALPNGCLGEFLSVVEENGRLFLKALPDFENDNKLTIKLSAEYLWNKFTLTLKNNSN